MLLVENIPFEYDGHSGEDTHIEGRKERGRERDLRREPTLYGYLCYLGTP